MSKFLGIDPGLSGGIALVEDGTPIEWMVTPRHGDKGDIDWYMIADWLRERGEIEMAVIEKVSAMPGQGVSSMFRFGQTYGGARALVESMTIPHELVTPQRWKKAILKDMDRSSKDSAGIYLGRRFPKHDFRATQRSRKPHDGICDAICLALYAERTFSSPS